MNKAAARFTVAAFDGRPTACLHSPRDFQGQFVEIFLPFIERDFPFVHQSQQIAVGTDVVEAGLDRNAVLVGAEASPRSVPLFWRRPPDRRRLAGASGDLLPDLAVRDGDWKLLCDYDGANAQLFHVTDDPGEKTELSALESDRLARLKRSALAWHASLPPDRGAEPAEKPPPP